VTWPLLHRAQAALPILGLIALAASLAGATHPAAAGGLAAWPLYALLGYLTLFRIEGRAPGPYLAWSHATLALLLVAAVTWELIWRASHSLALAEGWRVAAVALAPLVMLLIAARSRPWPLSSWRAAYGLAVGGTLAFALVLWTLWSVRSPGDTAPLPWLPLLNPLDALLAAILLALWHWWTALRRGGLAQPTPDTERAFRLLLAALAFLWINLALLRALHRLGSVPYDWDSLFHSDLAQTSVAVLWGLVGVGLLLLARARQARTPWISGAVVLAAVVTKLFAIDLAASGTVERIVSFLAVGGLLVGIGWWSPLPPRAGEPPRG
jgi:uncharacterized membrane protein